MSIHQSHWEYLDCLRAVAILGVVAIHALSNITNTAVEVSWSWQLASMLNLALRWAVPVFVMISGALLLSKPGEPAREFYSKRVKRLVVPALVWMGIYFVWFNRGEYSYLVRDYLVRVLVWGNPYYHFYFIYVMLGLYVVTPILRVVVQQVSWRLVGFFAVLFVLMTAYWSYAIAWFTWTFPRDTLMVVTHFLPYVGYFLLGYLLHTVDCGRYRTKLFLVSGGLWLGAVMVTTFLFGQGGYSARSMMLEDYASLNVVVASVVVFVMIQTWYRSKKVNNPRWLVSLTGASFGIYLMHVIILEWLVRQVRSMGMGEWVQVLVSGSVALVVSWVVVEILGRSTGLRKLVGR